MIRRISWIAGSGSWLLPLVLLLWQWMAEGQHQATLSPEAYNAWKMSVLFADFSFAGALSLLAVLLGAMALAKTKEDEVLHPGKRMLELLVLALPMMLCLFIMGMLLVHG